MTTKLYEENAYCKDFSATVLACRKTENGYAAVLDCTAFFPEGGGQPADTGTIGEQVVSDVQIAEGVIVHTVSGALTPGETVTCAVDWERRFAHMQTHTAEHILSGLIHSRYGFNNVGFHMGCERAVLDTDGKLTPEDLRQLETAANRIVWENRAVTAAYPPPEELRQLTYRSKIGGEDGIRLVTVEGCDCCACCAPHVARTGEIGVIKILTSYPHRGGTRIEMTAGSPALEDYRQLHAQTAAISRLLSAGRSETDVAVAALSDTLHRKDREIKELREALALAQLDVYRCGGVVCAFSKTADYDAMTYCLNRLLPEAAICFVLAALPDGGHLYAAGSQTADLQPVAKALHAALGGRGGGKAHYIQGKLPASAQEIRDYLKTLR